MPIIKSAIKRVRQSSKRRQRNNALKQAVRLDSKAVLLALGNDTETVATALRAAASQIDRAVKKGALHKNTAARRKSRLAKLVNQSQTAATPKPAAKTKPAATKKAAAKKTPAKKSDPKK